MSRLQTDCMICPPPLTLSGTFAACVLQTDHPAARVATAESALHILALSALHTLYEDFKLSVLQWRALRPLAELLMTLASLLGAPNHIDHYLRDYGDLAVPGRGGAPGPDAMRKVRADPRGC